MQQVESYDVSPIDKAVKLLTESGFKLTRKIALSGALLKGFSPADYPDPENISFITVVDTETTGMSDSSEIIQLAAVKLAVHSETLELLGVADRYASFNQPELPIPEEITGITGITNEMVAGHRLDLGRVRDLLCGERTLNIAHGARFDREMIERNLASKIPELVGLRWACSHQEIAWPKGTAKLDYLLYLHGYHHDAHQAIEDVEALAELVFNTKPIDGGAPYFHRLLESSNKMTFDIYAVDTPYASKDILKQAGFYWNDGTNGKPKAWHVEVDESKLAERLGWLEEKIYSYKLVMLEKDARDRYAAIQRPADQPPQRPVMR